LLNISFISVVEEQMLINPASEFCQALEQGFLTASFFKCMT